MDLDIYKQFPEMKYFIGKNYVPGGKKALLVIGESNYLPEGSEIWKDPVKWYSSSSADLTDDEREWINISGIMNDEASKGKGFPNPAHSIFRLGFQKINEYGPKYSDYRDILDDIVFYNYFLRPAENGDSIVPFLEQIDMEIADQHFEDIVSMLKPRGIVFLSRGAASRCSKINSLTIPCAKAPHPGCKYWNIKCDCYGNRHGCDVVQDGLADLSW